MPTHPWNGIIIISRVSASKLLVSPFLAAQWQENERLIITGGVSLFFIVSREPVIRILVIGPNPSLNPYQVWKSNLEERALFRGLRVMRIYIYIYTVKKQYTVYKKQVSYIW